MNNFIYENRTKVYRRSWKVQGSQEKKRQK